MPTLWKIWLPALAFEGPQEVLEKYSSNTALFHISESFPARFVTR